MLDESEIVRRAREEARIIKNDARVEANELRIKAGQDAYKVLSAVEGELSQSLNTIRRRARRTGRGERIGGRCLRGRKVSRGQRDSARRQAETACRPGFFAD